MAVTSIWPITGDVGGVIEYAINPEKTTEESRAETAALHAIDNVVEYTADELKTEQRMYVSGINCQVDFAKEQFMDTKTRYGKLGGRTCYHGYQSFKAGEVDADTAHKIGVELAKELWGERFEVVVATHLNTGHYHNHFVINSVSFLDGYKYYNFKADYQRMREVSDRLCKEYGLSVIKNPKGKGKHYTEWQAEQQGKPIITKKNRVIVVDGGWPEDMPRLKECIDNREIAAWILTHPHKDHISGFVSEIEKNGGKDFHIDKIIYHFPPYEDLYSHSPEDYNYYQAEFEHMLPAFNSILPQIAPLTHIVQQGESITIDEVKIDVLFTYHDYLTSNVMNDSSLVFKVTTPTKSILFLGDIGPQGGDVLYWESRDLLKADIVQMAHHGHVCCGMEVYAAIAPKICLWNTDEWLYNEKEVPEFLADFELARKRNRTRMYGTPVTRKWMECLGVKEHYYTKDGTQVLKI